MLLRLLSTTTRRESREETAQLPLGSLACDVASGFAHALIHRLIGMMIIGQYLI